MNSSLLITHSLSSGYCIKMDSTVVSSPFRLISGVQCFIGIENGHSIIHNINDAYE